MKLYILANWTKINSDEYGSKDRSDSFSKIHVIWKPNYASHYPDKFDQCCLFFLLISLSRTIQVSHHTMIQSKKFNNDIVTIETTSFPYRG